MVVLAWALLRRRLAGVLWLVLVVPRVALGQDAQRSITDGGDWLFLHESRMDAPWTPAVTLSLNHATKLATLVGPARPVDLLERVTTQELDLSVQLGRVVRLGVSAPRHTGIQYLNRQRDAEWGDVSVWAMLPMSNQDGEGLEAAWIVQFDQPGNGGGYILSDPGALQGMVTASGDVRWGQLTAELGFRLHEPVAIPGGTWGDNLLWGVGWRYDELGPFILGTEWMGRLPMRLLAMSPPEAPAEGSLVVGFRPIAPITLQAAAGAGLNLGLGAPRTRFVGAVDVRPRAQSDLDADGIADHRDVCRRTPEDADGHQDWDGCPDNDNDGDGIADGVDGCPDVAENLNGIDDQDGCPEAVTKLVVVVHTDGDAERVALRIGNDSMDVFPGEAVAVNLTAQQVVVSAVAEAHSPVSREVALGLEAHVEVQLQLPLRPMGTLRLSARVGDEPVVAQWRVTPDGHEGVLESSPDVALEVPAGEVDVMASAEGYLPVSATLDVLTGEEQSFVAQLVATGVRADGDGLVVGEQVFFALDEDVIREERGLQDVLAWLQAHPEAQLVRIEGHSDPIGRSRYNYELSVKRAESVRGWLVDHGIAGDRLQAIGTGEARLGGAHEDDRRVGFTVLVWAD